MLGLRGSIGLSSWLAPDTRLSVTSSVDNWQRSGGSSTRTVGLGSEVEQRFASDRDKVFKGAPMATGAMMPDVTAEDIARDDIAIDEARPGNSSAEWVRATPPEKLKSWDNRLTLRSLELYRTYEPGAFVAQISPTPLLMITTDNDTVTPTDEILGAYNRALEPKRLVMLQGGHCDLYAFRRKEAVAAALKFYQEFL